MTTTVNVVLFKSKTLANGKHPLMIRVCKDNKKKYKSIGLALEAKYWDDKKNAPRRNCPDIDSVKKIIADKLTDYHTQVLRFKTTQKNFTASTLIKTIEADTTILTVDEFYNELIANYRAVGQIGNSNVYRDSYNSLKTFKKTDNLDFYFVEIDFAWLNDYENFLIKCGKAETTMSILFRTLRSTYNKAIKQNIAHKEDYPFDTFKVSKFNTKTKKRAISKDDILRIMKLDLSAELPLVQLSRDLFIFSYLQGGINITDIAHLKDLNIADGRLEYVRQKTKGDIAIPLQEKAMLIIQKYVNLRDVNDDYLFPILNSNIHRTAMQKHNRIHKIVRKINQNLKIVAHRAKIEANLTTYVARHSYATVLKRSGVNTSIISESLGHSSEKVTQIYLDSFENSQIDEAMKNLL